MNDRNLPSSPLELLKLCGGYYSCPKDKEAGKRLGPLVGYHATYAENPRAERKHYVGDEYFDFSKVETFSRALYSVAENLYIVLEAKFGHRGLASVTGFCAAPEGGKALGCAMAGLSGNFAGYNRYIYPEKKVLKVGKGSERDEEILIFDRHSPLSGQNWIIVEDVAHNFSTSAQIFDMIEKVGANVVAIVCFCDRSGSVDSQFTSRSGKVVPVISLIKRSIPRYRQDDPSVIEDIKSGNVVWRPKKNEHWARLQEVMLEHAAA